ncbi:tannase/feruloyl esterase family alpha/beta hydrolase [Propionivibrio limicola]|uniref:tannase/feruloyl esterase family alpha/beta hydrolase n=1 Tax=Propionivibrio limicola TaxID=167645 RepID=UPI001B86FBA4|nr:tannase/feruloyl esterase family alpha/beta hydrolase [Propionivibrio limicola]
MHHPSTKELATDGRFRLKSSLRMMALCGVLGISAFLTACGGSDSDDEVAVTEPSVPQLSAAVGTTLSKCADLASTFSYSGLKITSSTLVAAGSTVTADGETYTLPEHCYVQGYMNERVSVVDGQTYRIGFEMKLPKDWNGRFFFQPNGGTEGTLLLPQNQANGRMLGGGPVTTGLNKGFAVLSSDSGHDGNARTDVAASIRGAVFGIDPGSRTDNAHRYVATLTPMAKGLIAAAYGKGPDRSYMIGCSNGGRVALVTAARYPDMFDGILSAAPAVSLPTGTVAAMWNAQAMAPVSPLVDGKADISNSFIQAEMDLVKSKVLAKCDALDGVADGIVADYKACKTAFSLTADVPTCTGGETAGTCLTSAQKTAMAKLMGGPKKADGTAIYADMDYDPGMAAPGWRAWMMGMTSNAAGPASASNPTSQIFNLMAPSMGLMFSSPAVDPATLTSSATGLFDYVMNFNMTTDLAKVYATGNGFADSPWNEYTPPNRDDLSALRNRGGKVLLFHGTADPIWYFNDTINWYEALKAKMGSNTESFSRVFPVPGMNHCSGGPAADRFDMVTALVDWVEKGQAPESVMASVRPVAKNSGMDASWPTNRTRLLCPYPKVARYKGTGNTEDAINYSCQ